MSERGKIGDDIRFIFACCEKGARKKGKIVALEGGWPVIFVPECTCVSTFSSPKCPASVQCGWGNIEVILRKNQQLLFSFME